MKASYNGILLYVHCVMSRRKFNAPGGIICCTCLDVAAVRSLMNGLRLGTMSRAKDSIRTYTTNNKYLNRSWSQDCFHKNLKYFLLIIK